MLHMNPDKVQRETKRESAVQKRNTDNLESNPANCQLALTSFSSAVGEATGLLPLRSRTC